MSKTCLSELDIIFISYDEANAEENYADLITKVPWAKRVHGVRGSDAAHKAAAKLSETERFITVDADNIVDSDFFDLVFDFDDPKFKGKVLSWAAKNEINGLVYGNGGLKCWPVQHVLNMKTHEASEDVNDKRSQIEFCWDNAYLQMNNQYCHTYPNSSPLHAFRAGFREGVKMSLDQAEKVANDEFTSRIWHGNRKRLLIWLSVGADVDNGLWAIYGARLGCQMTNLTDWDYIQVRDFDYLTNLFNDSVLPQFDTVDNDMSCVRSGISWTNQLLLDEIVRLGEELRESLNISLADLDTQGSLFFKNVYVNLPRNGRYVTEEEANKMNEGIIK